MSSLRIKSGRRLVRLAVVAGVVMALLGATVLGVTADWLRTVDRLVETAGGYASEPLFESYFLYDLGVADIDGDGHYDIFTTNHGATQDFRMNDGSGAFLPNAMSSLGFAYTPLLPGLRSVPELPAISGSGLRIDHWRSAIVVRSHGDVAVGGSLLLNWPATVVSRGAMTVHRDVGAGWALPETTAIRFDAAGSGMLVVEPQPAPTDGVPLSITLDPEVSLAQVAVGTADVRPPSHELQLTPGDRHGMAWADADGDGMTDVFISTGGQRGRADSDDSLRDALYVARPDGTFEDVIARTGIEKAGCPGRRAAWVDIDNDGLLDLYQVCGRGDAGGARAAVANRLYVQQPDGRFEEAAAAWGLAIEAFGTFQFLDVDDDGRIDLFWAGQDRYTLYRNTGSRFVPEDLGPTPPGPGSRLRQISVGDVDGDGAIDVFVASRDGNTLFMNDGGDLHPVDPASLGLPKWAHSASLVDTNNNGRLDLAALPGGIFRQQADGRFASTGELRATTSLFMNDARAGWVDVDGDGTLDAVVAARPCWPGRACAAEERGLSLLRRLLQQWTGIVPPSLLYEPLRWLVTLHRAAPAEGHWLAVDVAGAPGNRQSIGARVTVVTRDGRQVAEVGQLEGAHQGQGNYRLHFGLGNEPGIARIEVRWPDGTEAVLQRPGADQLVTIRHPAAG